LRPDAPAFAAYVDKYVVPSFYRAALAGADGSRYVEVSGGDGHVQVSLCARDGRLVSLDTPRRPLPDSLVLRSDFSARYRRFRIGYTGMVTDFTIERGPHLAAWMLRFRHEPAWHFPLAFDKLIRTPLRRPFEDRGMELRLGLRDGEGEQTSSFREARLTVHESAIMRWLGRLGATAFGEFSGRAEAEENLFLTQFFAALRADVTGLSER
jgi:hypothetical protein